MTIPFVQCHPTVPGCISYSTWKGKEVIYCLYMFAALITICYTLMFLNVTSPRFRFAFPSSFCIHVHMLPDAGCY